MCRRGTSGLLIESDDDLLHRCLGGDQTAWRDLVSRHTRRVFSLAYRFVGRVDEAEDLTQEIFVKVYQSLDRYRPAEGAFPTWLTTVARNHAIDHHRAGREERLRRAEAQDLLDGTASSQESPLKSLERAERAELVRRGIRSLPPELREALVLCDLEGLAYGEIAVALEIPLGTVKSRINRGRVELAKRLLGRRNEYAGTS